jgi:hypothetical protein
VSLLGELPLDIRIREETDGGARPSSSAPGRRGSAYLDMARRTAATLSRRAAAAPGFPADRRRGHLTVSIKSDRWIRRMAEGHGMIEPFEPGTGARRRRPEDRLLRHVELRLRRALRVEFKIFTNINSTIVDPKDFDDRLSSTSMVRRLHHPAEFLRAGPHGRVFPHPAQRADGVPRQVDVCALRHHRQRDAAGARVGRARDARVLEHHDAAREDLRERRRRADAVLRVGRGLRDVLQGPRRQVSGPARALPTLPKGSSARGPLSPR